MTPTEFNDWTDADPREPVAPIEDEIGKLAYLSFRHGYWTGMMIGGAGVGLVALFAWVML